MKIIASSLLCASTATVALVGSLVEPVAPVVEHAHVHDHDCVHDHEHEHEHHFDEAMLEALIKSTYKGMFELGTLDKKKSTRPLAMACFAPGTALEIVRSLGEDLHGLGLRFFVGGPWPQPDGAFTGVNLTWSVPDDGLFIPQQLNGDSSGNNEIHARLGALIGPEATWKGLIQQSFDAWSAVTGNTYTEIPDDGAAWGASGGPTRGDIRIVMRNIDGGSGTLAFNFFPTSGGANGDMVIDRSENWGAGGANFRFFRNVIMHEHGHGQGIFHSCPVEGNKLMEPFINTSFDGPQLDDFRAGMFLYGDRFEPNNDFGDAVDLTALGLAVNNGQNLTNLSLHGVSDSDRFSFTPPDGSRVTATVIPQGFTYLNAAQAGNGSCPSGSLVDALRQLDPVLEVLAPDGSVLDVADDGGLGESENITGLNLGSPGTYQVRVRAGAGSGVSQIYDLIVTIQNDGLIGDLNFDGCIGSGDLSILIGRWGQSGTGDLDGDGMVGSNDLAILLGTWGTGCGS